MTNCAKCGRVLTSGNRARGHAGVVQWCAFCPPAQEYTWGREVVGSGTGWAGGRVSVDIEDPDAGGWDIDPRDFDDVEAFNPRSGAIIVGGEAAVNYDAEASGAFLPSGRFRRDRVTAGPLAGIDLVHYMRTGEVKKL